MITHTINREIGIDLGHRVPAHHSHCRNLHGHRYRIQASVKGSLIDTGSQNGMVVDFGFLKEAMMTHIHANFDHKLCLYRKDIIFQHLVNPHAVANGIGGLDDYFDKNLFLATKGSDNTDIVAIDAIPTAENLAALWFHLLDPVVIEMAAKFQTDMALSGLYVWETPNSVASYERL